MMSNSVSTAKRVNEINRDLEERKIQKNARSLGVGYLDVGNYVLENIDVLRLVDRPDAEQAKLIPFYHQGKLLRVALVDLEKKETKDLLEKLQSQYEVEVFLCSTTGLSEALSQYESHLLNRQSIDLQTSFDEEFEVSLERRNSSFLELEKSIPSLAPEQAVNQIEIEAVRAGASDIHFQPAHNSIVVRFRIDGILHPVASLDRKVALPIISRVKFDAGMQSNVSDIPQDGRMSFEVNGRLIDVRVSAIPTEGVDSVVLRLLDSQKGIQNFEELGFSAPARERLDRVLGQKHGMVLITGPTGSGKTTTLYSILAQLNSVNQKLVTLEDPIEYHLEGVSQSQVNDKRGYDFDTGLKALLRHDPDVILIGEIRAYSTAKMAADASLTGHVVLSSLHTNSAVGSIARLRNLGLENFNIASSLEAVFAQRLLRKVCDCGQKKPILEDPKLMEYVSRLKKIFPHLKVPTHVVEKVGCDNCFHTGYKGRTVMCEALVLDEKIKKMILNDDSDLAIADYLTSETDFLSIFEDGLLKVLDGETTLEELYRVAGSVE